MHRIAGMTVSVKASGVPEAFYNGQRDRVVEAVRAEMERQNAAHEARERALAADCDARIRSAVSQLNEERARSEREHEKRCELLARESGRLRKAIYRRRSIFGRALGRIESGYAMAYAIIRCVPEIGERLGLWIDLGKEENFNAYCKRAA